MTLLLLLLSRRGENTGSEEAKNGRELHDVWLLREK